jgi:hypothetical protein
VKRLLVLLALAVLLIVASVALATGSQVNWHALSGGGGRVASGAYTLDAAVGQPVSGIVGAGSYAICAGVMCGAEDLNDVYLPMVVR